MHVLIIGSSTGREFAFAKRLHNESCTISAFLWCHNAKLARLCTFYRVGDIRNPEEVLDFARSHTPDIVVIGQGESLEIGVADALENDGFKCASPKKCFSILESSKSFTQNLAMEILPGIVIPSFEVKHYDEAVIRFEISKFSSNRVVVKRDGRINHNGVSIFLKNNFLEISNYIKDWIDTGGTILVQEFIHGEEVSLTTYTNGQSFLHAPLVRNYKKLTSDPMSPVTSGMGGVTLSSKNQIFDCALIDVIQYISEQILKKIQAFFSDTYHGPIIVEYFISDHNIYLIETNTRWANPGSINHLMLLEQSFSSLLGAVIDSRQDLSSFTWRDTNSLVAYVVPVDYPQGLNVGREADLAVLSDNPNIFYARMNYRDERFFLEKSRAFAFGCVGDDLMALCNQYNECFARLSSPVFWRNDIGRDIIQSDKEHSWVVDDLSLQPFIKDKKILLILNVSELLKCSRYAVNRLSGELILNYEFGEVLASPCIGFRLFADFLQSAIIEDNLTVGEDIDKLLRLLSGKDIRVVGVTDCPAVAHDSGRISTIINKLISGYGLSLSQIDVSGFASRFKNGIISTGLRNIGPRLIELIKSTFNVGFGSALVIDGELMNLRSILYFMNLVRLKAFFHPYRVVAKTNANIEQPVVAAQLSSLISRAGLIDDVAAQNYTGEGIQTMVMEQAIIKLLADMYGQTFDVKKINKGSNDVFLCQYADRKLIFKSYKNRGTHNDLEVDIQRCYPSFDFLRPLVHSDSECVLFKYPYALFRHVEGRSLYEIIIGGKLDGYDAQKISSGVQQIIEAFASIPVKHYGKMTSLSDESSQLSWFDYFVDYQVPTLSELRAFSDLVGFCDRFEAMIRKYEILLETGTKPTVIPVDLNMKNILVTPDNHIYSLSGAVMSADYLYGVTQYFAHLQGTLLGDVFLSNLKLNDPDLLKLSIYCISAHLNVLAFISKYTNESILDVKPWGNDRTFVELVDENLTLLEQSSTTNHTNYHHTCVPR